jgi:alkylhydroperoxidase family enzyme
MSFAYSDASRPIRETLPHVHRAVWARIASSGAWWTGEQRVAMAALVRASRKLRGEPPWLRSAPVVEDGPLPRAAAEAVRRIAIDAHQLDGKWCERVVAEFGDAAYVELVAVVVCVSAIEAFAEALGVEPEPLPEVQPGQVTRRRPDTVADAGAWVPMTVPWRGPNVARALSLVPDDHAIFMALVGTMYASGDFVKLVWDDRPLTRAQIELVAARVSAVNECFY